MGFFGWLPIPINKVHSIHMEFSHFSKVNFLKHYFPNIIVPNEVKLLKVELVFMTIIRPSPCSWAIQTATIATLVADRATYLRQILQ
jgi:hypothetical protein